ncbi:hypothetical protein BaRGS_00004051 [Batillaria attramentaria]|uniref:Uncharacterized protein n=1 Tax=Batillaria attramentaria TaxID=370345 RepID=A0ABD0LYF3_9CAEN
MVATTLSEMNYILQTPCYSPIRRWVEGLRQRVTMRDSYLWRLNGGSKREGGAPRRHETTTGGNVHQPANQSVCKRVHPVGWYAWLNFKAFYGAWKFECRLSLNRVCDTIELWLIGDSCAQIERID